MAMVAAIPSSWRFKRNDEGMSAECMRGGRRSRIVGVCYTDGARMTVSPRRLPVVEALVRLRRDVRVAYSRPTGEGKTETGGGSGGSRACAARVGVGRCRCVCVCVCQWPPDR